jgi:hypothetical protein
MDPYVTILVIVLLVAMIEPIVTIKMTNHYFPKDPDTDFPE